MDRNLFAADLFPSAAGQMTMRADRRRQFSVRLVRLGEQDNRATWMAAGQRADCLRGVIQFCVGSTEDNEIEEASSGDLALGRVRLGFGGQLPQFVKLALDLRHVHGGLHAGGEGLEFCGIWHSFNVQRSAPNTQHPKKEIVGRWKLRVRR